MPAPKNNNYAKGNKGGGRKTVFKPEYVEQTLKLCRLGATDVQLADFFNVTEATINNWKKEHKEFVLALKEGKELSDAEVADRLFKRATGYSHPDVDIKCYEGQIITTEITKHYPPDTTAAIFWLKNRNPAMWRDKQEIAATIEGVKIINIVPVNGGNKGK